MTHSRSAFLAFAALLSLGAATLPASALGIAFDLPRLDFPADDGAGATRGCTTAPAPCAPVGR